MRGGRRRPYVDMVKPGNEADDRPGRNPEGDGALWAHFFVGTPCNIDILLRALLLELPTAAMPAAAPFKSGSVGPNGSRALVAPCRGCPFRAAQATTSRGSGLRPGDRPCSDSRRHRHWWG